MADDPQVTLPAGYKLDSTPAAGVQLPAGYKLDGPAQAQPQAQPKEGFWHSLYDATVGGAVNTAKRVIGTDELDQIHKQLQQGNYKAAALLIGQYTTEGPSRLGTDIVEGSVRQGQAAIDAAKAGKPGEAALHYVAAAPLVGPLVAKPIQQVASGDYAGAGGTLLGDALTLGAPKVLSAVKAKIPILPALENPNVSEAAALDALQARGVPVPAGARTGNLFIKNIQKASDATPAGSYVAQNAQRETTAALRNAAADIVSDAAPPQTAESLYDNFRKAEASPSNTRSVPTGEVDAKGDPVTTPMPMPVNVGSLKAKLQPIFDEMEWMPAADRNASAGYQAVKKILTGPDYVPASTAEIGLGGIKTMAREGAGRNAGLAKYIIPQLQELIDNTVSGVGGEGAMKALQQGRAAAAAEAGQNWLADTFKKAEAEGGFNREHGVWADWLRLSDEAKRSMFTPNQASDLHNFFLGVKKLAENPNPSGSAVLGVSAGSGGLVLANPTTGIPLMIGAGALSKLLRSPAVVKALTKGMSVSLADRPTAIATANRIAQLVGNSAKPLDDSDQKQ